MKLLSETKFHKNVPRVLIFLFLKETSKQRKKNNNTSCFKIPVTQLSEVFSFLGSPSPHPHPHTTHQLTTTPSPRRRMLPLPSSLPPFYCLLCPLDPPGQILHMPTQCLQLKNRQHRASVRQMSFPRVLHCTAVSGRLGVFSKETNFLNGIMKARGLSDWPHKSARSSKMVFEKVIGRSKLRTL